MSEHCRYTIGSSVAAEKNSSFHQRNRICRHYYRIISMVCECLSELERIMYTYAVFVQICTKFFFAINFFQKVFSGKVFINVGLTLEEVLGQDRFWFHDLQILKYMSRNFLYLYFIYLFLPMVLCKSKISIFKLDIYQNSNDFEVKFIQSADARLMNLLCKFQVDQCTKILTSFVQGHSN